MIPPGLPVICSVPRKFRAAVTQGCGIPKSQQSHLEGHRIPWSGGGGDPHRAGGDAPRSIQGSAQPRWGEGGWGVPHREMGIAEPPLITAALRARGGGGNPGRRREAPPCPIIKGGVRLREPQSDAERGVSAGVRGGGGGKGQRQQQGVIGGVVMGCRVRLRRCGSCRRCRVRVSVAFLAGVPRSRSVPGSARRGLSGRGSGAVRCGGSSRVRGCAERSVRNRTGSAPFPPRPPPTCRAAGTC